MGFMRIVVGVREIKNLSRRRGSLYCAFVPVLAQETSFSRAISEDCLLV